MVGFPDGQRIYITKDDLADLKVHLDSLGNWIAAANICLGGKPL